MSARKSFWVRLIPVGPGDGALVDELGPEEATEEAAGAARTAAP